MRIEIVPSGWVTVSKAGGELLVTLNPDEQRELLETLARANSFALVDQAEQQTLRELVEEVEDDPNVYDVARGWKAWQDRAEALASAVTQALKEA